MEGAGGEGLPTSRHGLLPRSGGCARKPEAGAGRGAQGADSPAPTPQERKVYVQHRLRELGPLVWELLDHQGACFYLAG